MFPAGTDSQRLSGDPYRLFHGRSPQQGHVNEKAGIHGDSQKRTRLVCFLLPEKPIDTKPYQTNTYALFGGQKRR
jgi:hypothetical protein